jgi:hypothetical protein
MIFEVRPILSFILPKSLHLQFKKCFFAFLQDIYSHAAKFFILLLCFNLLLISSNHVICMELSEEGITKIHFQQYECRSSQNSESGIYQRHNKDEAPQFLPTDILGTTPSCPECVDEHILFKKSSAGVDFSPAILLMHLLPVSQSNLSQSLLTTGSSSVPQELRFPFSSFKSSVIRSTILLI